MQVLIPQNIGADDMQLALAGRDMGVVIIDELRNMPGFFALVTGRPSVTHLWASVVTAEQEQMHDQVSEAFVRAHHAKIEADTQNYLSYFSDGAQTKLLLAWDTIDADDSGLVDEDEFSGFVESNPSYQQTFLECGVQTPMNKAQFMKFWKDLSIFLGIADILLEDELDRILNNMDAATTENKDKQLLQEASYAVVRPESFATMTANSQKAYECILQVSADLQARTHALSRRRKDLAERSGQSELGMHELMKLNVGGDTNFILRRSTLVDLKSRLAELFDWRWKNKIPKDSEGCVFIDAEPRQMRAILDWLADAKKIKDGTSHASMRDIKHPLERLPESQHWGLRELIEYYGLQEQLGSADNPISQIRSEELQENLESTCICTEEHFAWLLNAVKLSNMLPPSSAASEIAVEPWPMKPKLNLIFRASRDGYSARAFHRNCDDTGPTILVANDGQGYSFGGFCDISWQGNGRTSNAPQAFIFELGGRGVTQPVMRRISKAHGGIYDHPCQGPQWGSSPELRINGSNSNRTTATMKRPSVDTDYEGITTVPVSDYEVYNVTWQRSHIEEFAKMAEIVPRGLLQDALKLFFDAVVSDEHIRHALDNEDAEINSGEEEWRRGMKASPWVASYMRSMSIQNPIITFNVRGVKMATMSSTLELAGGSPLARRIQKQVRGEAEQSEMIEGAVFLDEDPQCFECVLNYLRLIRMGYRMKKPQAPYGKEVEFLRLAGSLGMARMM